MIPKSVIRHFAFQFKVKGYLLLRISYLVTYYFLYLLLDKDHSKAMNSLVGIDFFNRELTVILPNGVRMVCTLFDVFIHIKEIYADGIYDRFPVNDKSVVLDIGAQIGTFSVKTAMETGANVIAFEPFPVNFRLLQENTELNKLTNITLFNVALWDTAGEMKLFIDKLSTGGHSLIEKESAFVTVKTMTLDHVIEELKLKKIDIIKMDTEGAEIKILQGGTNVLKVFRPRIIMECHDTAQGVKELLEGFNYSVTIKDVYIFAEPY